MKKFATILPVLAAWLSAAGTEPTNVVVHWQSTSPSGASRIATAAYYDGLGRHVASVAEDASPDGGDIVEIKEYDAAGRPFRQWLPAPVAAFEAGALESVKEAAETFYGDSIPYAETAYEQSALSRPVEAWGAGEAWRGALRPVRTAYTLSTAAKDMRCMMLSVGDGGELVKEQQHYPAGRLDVTLTEDEDKRQTILFTDMQGRTVAARRWATEGSAALDTYYVRDGFGRLRYVVPPKLSLLLEAAPCGEWDTADDDVWDYAFYYEYDSRGLCTLRKLPGREPVFARYDKGGKPVLSQDGNQRERGEWTLRLFDKFRREAVVAIVKASEAEAAALQSAVVRVEYAAVEGDLGGYSANVPLPDIVELRTVRYYDNYDFIQLLPEGERAGFAFQAEAGFPEAWDDPTGTQTGSRIYRGGGEYALEALWRDGDGNVVQRRAANHLGGIDEEYASFTLTGKPLAVLRRHSKPGGATVEERTEYAYDAAERLAGVSHALGGETLRTVIAYGHDALGRVEQAGFNGGTFPVSYERDVRGRTTLVACAPFRQELAYETPNGAAVPSTPQYSGKISAEAVTTPIGRSTEATRLRRYRYDDAGRLVEAAYSETAERDPFDRPVFYGNEPDFSATYAYDANGNMTSFQRKGAQSVIPVDENEGAYRVWTFGTIDDVTLTLDGNRVVKAVDEAPQVAYGDCFHFAGGNGSDDADDYLYDANGNLAADRNKGIASIEYDVANLPEKVTFEGSRFSLAYLYDAEGRKLRASYGMFASQRPDTAATVVPVFPARPTAEAQSMIMPPGTWRRDYCGNVIYKDGAIERVLTPEGYAVPDGGGWKRYVYVRDVQGNIRAVVGEDNAVAEQTDYYPYGMPMADVNSASAQPFKFGGKELEREGGADFYDFEARRLDFAIGRFTSPDPLCEQTPEVSPYAYCSADPVNRVDPDGKDDYQLNEDGHIFLIKRTDAETHTIYASNSAGSVNKGIFFIVSKPVIDGRENTEIPIEQNDGTITYENGIAYNFQNDTEASSFFEFVAVNSNVEWSFMSANGKNGSYNVVGTTYSHDTDSSLDYFRVQAEVGGFSVAKAIHNHPGKDSSSIISDADLKVAQSIFDSSPNAKVFILRYDYESGKINYRPIYKDSKSQEIDDIFVYPPRTK